MHPETCPNGGSEIPDGPLTWPQYVYSHDVGCAVIGGPVIADPALPELNGRLIWGDFCSGWVKTATPRTGSFTDAASLLKIPSGRAPRAPLNGFGEDRYRRLYLLTNSGGVLMLKPGSTLRR